MKTIEPVSIWSNGVTKEATQLIARIVNDDLSTSCTFYYDLRETTTEGYQGQSLTQGNLLMEGQDYLDWDGSNDAAYTFIAASINVTIVP